MILKNAGIVVVLFGTCVIDGLEGVKLARGASVSSQSNNTQTKSSETIYKVGDVIKTSKLEMCITRVRKLDKVGTKYLDRKPAEGAVFVAIDYKYKNISKEGYYPSVNLISPDKAKYSLDVSATISYSSEQETNSKVISDLNPGVTANDVVVFEISKEEIIKKGWLIDFDGKKVSLEL